MSQPDDLHTFAVCEGLRCIGIEPTLWLTADFPTLQMASLRFAEGQVTLEGRGRGFSLSSPHFHSVWIRRPGSPVLPAQVAEADRTFAYRECTLFLRSLREVIDAPALWVNSAESRGRAQLRSEQLRAAQQAGLPIPVTLCSNDPRAIRRFLREAPGEVIYKSFFPVSWKAETEIHALFTAVVERADLPPASLLQATPGIFQHRLPKAHELRVTAIGRHLFAVKIFSQELSEAELDWRVVGERIRMEPAELPAAVARSCHAVMELLGLAFGCFDLVVTPEGAIYFLEVNEMGAFLWIEERFPELGLLDAFCQLLVQGRTDFPWHPGAASVRWERVAKAAAERLQEAVQEHAVNPTGVVHE